MNYKKGDKVYIKELQDMIHQFGQEADGSIPCEGVFVPKMFYTCGKPVTIMVVDNNTKRYRVSEYPNFVFSDDMLTEWTQYNELIHQTKEHLAISLSQAFNLSYVDIYNWLNGRVNGAFIDTKKTPINKITSKAETVKDVIEDQNVFNSIQDYDFSSVLNSSQWEWNLS